ncbi:MAG: phycobilisome polypeptide [Synechococcus sp.]
MTSDPGRLKALAQAARVCGLTDQPSLNPTCKRVLAEADRSKRPLTDEELRIITSASGIDHAAVHSLQTNAVAFVQDAKARLADQRPQLLKPGGALHPASRAEACWRDCRDFFRVIIYAVACGQAQFTDPEGMAALRELYAGMGVPRDGLNIALEQLKHLSQQQTTEPTAKTLVTAAFDHLIGELNKSAVKS